MKTIVLFLLFQFACIGIASWAFGWIFDDPNDTATRDLSGMVTLGSFVLMAVAFFVFGDRFMAEMVKRKWIVPTLFLALCLPTAAAPLPPFPTVKRPAPLLSPKAASAPKSAPMVKSFSPASMNPPIPMTVYFEEVNDDFGKYKITAELIQPPGQATLFEYSPKLGPWRPLSWFGADPVYSQQISAYIHSSGEAMFIRATVTPYVNPGFAASAVRSSTGVAVRIASDVRGAGASARKLK